MSHFRRKGQFRLVTNYQGSRRCSFELISNALEHERNEVTRVLEQVAPYRVISRSRLSGDNFRQRLTLSFEGRDFIADLNQHVPE
jgi:hypothetical protein